MSRLGDSQRELTHEELKDLVESMDLKDARWKAELARRGINTN